MVCILGSSRIIKGSCFWKRKCPDSTLDQLTETLQEFDHQYVTKVLYVILMYTKVENHYFLVVPLYGCLHFINLSDSKNSPWWLNKTLERVPGRHLFVYTTTMAPLPAFLSKPNSINGSFFAYLRFYHGSQHTFYYPKLCVVMMIELCLYSPFHDYLQTFFSETFFFAFLVCINI